MSERTLVQKWYGQWMIALEFKPQDCWVGLFWKRGRVGTGQATFDAWLCVVPMLPIHISWQEDLQRVMDRIHNSPDMRVWRERVRNTGAINGGS